MKQKTYLGAKKREIGGGGEELAIWIAKIGNQVMALRGHQKNP